MRKKILFIFLFALLGCLINNFVKADDDNSEKKKICTSSKKTYFFVLGVEESVGNDSRTNSTTFDDELPDTAKFLSIKVTERNMTLTDFKNYLHLIDEKNGYCSGKGANGAPICKIDEDGIHLRSNSGDNTKWSGFDSAQNNPSNYWNNNIVQPSDIRVSCQNSSSGGVVACSIDRTWNDNGKSNYTVPAVAEIEIEYEADDCGEDEEKEQPKECPAKGEKNKEKGNLECRDGDYKETLVIAPTDGKAIRAERIIKDGDPDFDHYTSYSAEYKKGLCSSELNETISGKVIINQKGNASFNFSPSNVVAGTGFSFNANYSGEAHYSICDYLTYTINESVPKFTCNNHSSTTTEKSINIGTDAAYTIISNISFSTPEVNQNAKKCEYTKSIKETYEFSTYNYNENKNFYINLCDGEEKIYTDVTNIGKKYCSGQYSETNQEEKPSSHTCVTKSVDYDCHNVGEQAYNCTSNGESQNELDAFAEEMAGHVVFPDSSTFSVKTKDSNVNKSDDVDMAGHWETNSTSVNKWYPEKSLRYNFAFVQDKACIGLYPNSDTMAPVSYLETGNCDTAASIDGGNLYFIPLKWNKKEFPVSVNIQNVSFISLMNWPLNYKCHANVEQKLYDGNKYKFIYRPIDMKNIFPHDRTPGSNWVNFMKKADRDENFRDTHLSRNSLEYDASNFDLTDINYFKNNTNFKGSYYNLKTINRSGKAINNKISDFRKINNANQLGKCEDFCW